MPAIPPIASSVVPSGAISSRAGPTSRFYVSQRLRLHYVDWGNPEAPPLILLHGGRDHCRNWDWVAAELCQDWQVTSVNVVEILV